MKASEHAEDIPVLWALMTQCQLGAARIRTLLDASTRAQSTLGAYIRSSGLKLNHDTAQQEMASVINRGIAPIPEWDTAYPERLRGMGAQRPPLLLVQGATELLQRPMSAIVGARRATRAGLEAAAFYARAAVEAGATVVSGGAKGADSAAHDAALDAGGTTVVVLPFGHDHFSPSHAVRDALSQNRAAVVSAYLPAQGWLNHQAHERNGLICAFARCMCVVDPGATGGSARTGAIALERGLPVLVFGETDGAARLASLGATHMPQCLDPNALETFRRAWDRPATAQVAQGRLFG